MVRVHQGPPLLASVAKLADALDLGSSALRRGGSSPFTRTIKKLKALKIQGFFILNVLPIIFLIVQFSQIQNVYYFLSYSYTLNKIS